MRRKRCESCGSNDSCRHLTHKADTWWMCQECYDSSYSQVHAKYPFIGARYRWNGKDVIVEVLDCKPQWLGARYVITSAPWLGADQIARYDIHAFYRLFEPVDNVVQIRSV